MTMVTTTARFDAHTFAEIRRRAALLGIKPSAFVRLAVMEKLVRLEQADRLAAVEVRLDRITNVVMHLVAFVERRTGRTVVPRRTLDQDRSGLAEGTGGGR